MLHVLQVNTHCQGVERSWRARWAQMPCVPINVQELDRQGFFDTIEFGLSAEGKRALGTRPQRANAPIQAHQNRQRSLAKRRES
jgi:hypothetical protein